MKQKKFDWQVWIEKREKCKKAFESYLKINFIKLESETQNLKISHMKKADYNLDFINFLLSQEKFYDWVIVGCYYAIYRASQALLALKGYSSKKHISTLCAIINLYFHTPEKLISEEDIELIAISSLEKEEVGYFVEAKEKRETASYGIGEEFTEQQAKELKDKTILFINKVKNILENIK